MAMSGLPPRPSTIGANSLITLPAWTSFLSCFGNKDIDLVTDGCDKNKHIRVIFFVSVIRKGTKAPASDTEPGWQYATVSVCFWTFLKTSRCRCCCFFFLQFCIFFCNDGVVLEDLQPERDFFELRCFRCCDCFQCIFLFTISFEGFLTSHCQDTTSSIRSLLLDNLEESNSEVLPTWVPPQSSTE